MTDIANLRYGARAFRWLVRMEMLKYEQAMMEFREMQKTAKRCAPECMHFVRAGWCCDSRQECAGRMTSCREPKLWSSRRGGLLKFIRPAVAVAHLLLSAL